MAGLPRVSPASDFITRVRKVVGDGPCALHEPSLGAREQQLVNDCLRSGYVSSVGAYVTQFEQSLAALTDARRVVAVTSGTAALHLALMVVGVRPGDEVLVPSATFVATANAVSYCGAIPHFVDVEWRTLGMDPTALDEWLHQIAESSELGTFNRVTGRRISACIPMHTFGHATDMVGIVRVAQSWGLRIVEDAAEALGSMLNGQHCGTFGDVGTLSFNGNKIVTTGGGGALLTNDAEIAQRARHLSTTAKVPHQWDFVHDEVGFNYRMPNLNAALGCAQLERLADMLASKRQLVDRYSTALADSDLGSLFLEPAGHLSNYWLQTFILHECNANLKEQVLADANAAGLQLRPLWRPMHTLAPYISMPRAPLPVTEQLAARVINLPSSAGLA